MWLYHLHPKPWREKPKEMGVRKTKKETPLQNLRGRVSLEIDCGGLREWLKQSSKVNFVNAMIVIGWEH